MKTNYNKEGLDKIEVGILLAILIVIIFSFIAPALLTNDSFHFVDLSGNGEIGDTIGGIMNPFIAIAGVLITFLAFYIQFKANKLQRRLFKEELEEQQKQTQSNKFENQFYEMLRLHKENVNEISLDLTTEVHIGKTPFIKSDKVNGREVFKYLVEEIKILYYVTKHVYSTESPDLLLRKAYEIFFHGINSFKRNKDDVIREAYLMSIEKIRNEWKGNKLFYKNYIDKNVEIINHNILEYQLFGGYSSLLAHYYRHLYQTVKFVVQQSLLTYEQKRNYLRILRAQLSNQEQVMLFYNWKSNFGNTWEDSENRFFTDYRMIHNIYNEIIIKDFDLEEIFKINEKIYYQTELNREWDPLFEFQDWERPKK